MRHHYSLKQRFYIATILSICLGILLGLLRLFLQKMYYVPGDYLLYGYLVGYLVLKYSKGVGVPFVVVAILGYLILVFVSEPNILATLRFSSIMTNLYRIGGIVTTYFAANRALQ